MKQILPLLILFTAGAAWAAAPGGHGDDHAIPFKLVGYQTFNVVLMFAGLIYFLKTPVKTFFAQKRENYLAEAKKAEAARKAAEQERADIQARLNKLETTADESVARARAEAADLRKSLIAEAEALSKRIRDEAQSAAKQEADRARHQLRDELIKESLQIARQQLSQKVTPDDHKRLQANFIHNIQAVQK